MVGVEVDVDVSVLVGVSVAVSVAVSVTVALGVFVEVRVSTGVRDGVSVCVRSIGVTESVGVAEGGGVGMGRQAEAISTSKTRPCKILPFISQLYSTPNIFDRIRSQTYPFENVYNHNMQDMTDNLIVSAASSG